MPAVVAKGERRAAARGSACRARLFLVVTAVGALMIAENAGAAEVPPALQAALLHKIFPYATNIPPAEQSVLIVATAERQNEANTLKQAFASLGVTAEVVSPANAGSRVASGKRIAYLYAAPPTELAQQLVGKHLLTIGSHAKLAESGTVALAIGEAGGKPEIIIHRGKLKLDGHVLGASLLSRARLVDP